MNKANLLLLVLISIKISSCSINDSRDQAIDFEIRSVEYQSSNCEPERDACLMVELFYPYFDEGDSIARYLANRIIRNSTLDFLGMGDVEAAVTPELEVAVVELDSSFQRLKHDFATTTGWMAKLQTSEIYRNDSLIVLEVNTSGYFGGAHGQHNTRYFNFDRKSGRMVPMTEFVNLNSFIATAEKHFKAKYVKEDQSYVDAGFDFLGEKYVLPANYAFKGDSILLHYNHYEIAPYAAGQFDVAVPLK